MIGTPRPATVFTKQQRIAELARNGPEMAFTTLASISTTTFYPNVFVPHGFRIALILWLPCLVALVQRGTDPTNFSASIPNPLS